MRLTYKCLNPETRPAVLWMTLNVEYSYSQLYCHFSLGCKLKSVRNELWTATISDWFWSSFLYLWLTEPWPTGLLQSTPDFISLTWPAFCKWPLFWLDSLYLFWVGPPWVPTLRLPLKRSPYHPAGDREKLVVLSLKLFGEVPGLSHSQRLSRVASQARRWQSHTPCPAGGHRVLLDFGTDPLNSWYAVSQRWARADPTVYPCVFPSNKPFTDFFLQLLSQASRQRSKSIYILRLAI